MRKAWIPAVIASILGFGAISVYAEEVKLTDQERTEMRQRADSMREGNMHQVRTTGMRRDTTRTAAPMKVKQSRKHMKKHSKHKRSKHRS